MNRPIPLFVLIPTLILTIMAPAWAQYDPAADLNSDSRIDSMDLFLGAQSWPDTFSVDGLLGLHAAWHSSAPTPVPSLRLSACQPWAYAGNDLEVKVDIVDPSGRLINPGVQGGVGAQQITMSVSGAALFSNGQPAATALLNQAAGFDAKVRDFAAESVVVNASGGNLNNAVPLAVEFLPGGKISGEVVIFEPLNGQYRYPRSSEVAIFVIDPTSQTTVAVTSPGFFFGLYSTPSLKPGAYDLSFTPAQTSLPNSAACIRNVLVEAGKTTETVNAQMDLRPPGALLTGAATALDGSLLRSLSVTLAPAETDYCPTATLGDVAFSGLGSASLTYTIRNVPPGEYLLSAGGASTSTETLGMTLGEAIPITIGSGTVTWDLQMMPILPFNQTSPVGYARVAQPFAFEWSAPETDLPLLYSLELFDRCGNLLWHKNGLTELSAPYDGPALAADTYYSWKMSAAAVNGTLAAQGNAPVSGGHHFLVEAGQ